MKKTTKITVLFLMCLLAGCASNVKNKDMDSREDAKETKDRVVKTAKINAQLGIAYLERHDLKRAKQKLLLSLQQAPDMPEPWYSMAYFLEATGNKTEAKKYYMKAVEVAPERGDAHNNYGTFLCRMGEYKESIQQFQLAVADPNYLDPAGAYENAGLCARQIPSNQLAVTYFNRAIQQDPSRTMSLLSLAELYIKMNDYKKATEALNIYDVASAPTKQSLHLRDEINKQQSQPQIATHKSKVFAVDLEKARTYKQVVSLTKQHGVPLTHDPLLPYPPAEKIHAHITPESIQVKPLKIIAATTPAAKKKPVYDMRLGAVKSLRDYPTSKPFLPNAKTTKVASAKQTTSKEKTAKTRVATRSTHKEKTKLMAQK